MALQRPVTKALTCHNCQQWILRTFIGGVGGCPTFQRPPVSRPRRTLSTAPKRFNEARERTPEDLKEQRPLNEINDDIANTPEASLEAKDGERSQDNVPWYLQVQQPIERHESPMAARQRIPDLPEHPPDILKPLLEHVSIGLGMDDLSLLDLRSLDPPPALGANLLMIVGTARSEKHLHVSADRLCRWLRTAYRMSPYADGLLGRNELKLKLRRKAKRTRLLSAVGAKATANTEIDDGIRTGWVCVNLGRVPGGELPENQEKVQRAEGIVGFGARTDGCNVVVQMMTEEKRGELDLEKLWTDMLNRAKREQAKEDDGVSDVEGMDEFLNDPSSAALNDGTSAPPRQPTSSTFYPASHASASTAGQQLRAYHTSARRMQATAVARTTEKSDDRTGRALDGVLGKQTDNSAITTLTKLLELLIIMPAKSALEALGDSVLVAPKRPIVGDTSLRPQQDEDNVNDTPFVRAFYDTMPPFPGPQHWHMHIELLAHARSIGHAGTHSSVLNVQLRNMQLAGIVPEERTFKLVLQSILAPWGKDSWYDGTGRNPTFRKLHVVCNILEDMEACGYNPVSPDILELLYHVCVGEPPQPERVYDLNTTISALGAAGLRRRVQADDWPTFWRTWRSYPQRFLPRPAELYEVLFDAIGEGKLKDIREVIDVMRTYLPEMEREEPAVMLEEHGQLAKAVVRALEYVEPKLKDGGGSREWRGLYERCRKLVDG